MTEKRKYPRYSCKIDAKVDYYPGNPDEVDPEISVPESIKGLILDISAGGIFIVASELVSVNSPARVFFNTSKDEICAAGRIVRTGRLQDNPSEIARKYSVFSDKGENYIAIKFDEPLENFDENDI